MTVKEKRPMGIQLWIVICKLHIFLSLRSWSDTSKSGPITSVCEFFLDKIMLKRKLNLCRVLFYPVEKYGSETWTLGYRGKRGQKYQKLVLLDGKTEGKGEKSGPATRHGGALGDRRYNSYCFLTSALEGGGWSASRLCRALPPGGEPPVPIVPWVGRSGRREYTKNPLPLSGFEPYTLYWLSYPALLESWKGDL
jgi:hypothetical protein